MQIVQVQKNVRATDKLGRVVYELLTGHQYVLHDFEVARLNRDHSLHVLQPLDALLPRYQGQSLSKKKIIFPLVGGLGDTILMASSLHQLKQQYPDCQIHFYAGKDHLELMAMLTSKIQPQLYPAPADRLSEYAYFISMEGIELLSYDDCTSNLAMFARRMHTPLPGEVLRLQLNPEKTEHYDLGLGTGPRIGIGLTQFSFTKAYPHQLCLQLARELIQAGVHVYWFGNFPEIREDLPHAPPALNNLVGRTPTIESLVTSMAQMDAIITSDSFYMHIAGSLRLPTLAIFTSTAPAVIGGYTTITQLKSAAECSPCHAIQEQCPLDHPCCLAHYHDSLSPKLIAQQALQLLDPIHQQIKPQTPLATNR